MDYNILDKDPQFDLDLFIRMNILTIYGYQAPTVPSLKSQEKD